MVGEDGKEIGIDNGLYPHHAIFVSPSHFSMDPILSCNGRSIKVPSIPVFVGSAAELADNQYTTQNATINTGFYIPKNEKVFVQIDMVNYKEYDQNIYLVPEIEYFPGKPEGYLDSNMYVISPSTCDSAMGALGGTFVKPPAGVKKFNVNGTDMTFDTDGFIAFSRKLLA
jgi:hypothetical protein